MTSFLIARNAPVVLREGSVTPAKLVPGPIEERGLYLPGGVSRKGAALGKACLGVVEALYESSRTGKAAPGESGLKIRD